MLQNLQTTPTLISESGYTLGSIHDILMTDLQEHQQHDPEMHSVISGVNGVLSGANGIIEGSCLGGGSSYAGGESCVHGAVDSRSETDFLAKTSLKRPAQNERIHGVHLILCA